MKLIKLDKKQEAKFPDEIKLVREFYWRQIEQNNV
jgi:hypothetical protein